MTPRRWFLIMMIVAIFLTGHFIVRTLKVYQLTCNPLLQESMFNFKHKERIRVCLVPVRYFLGEANHAERLLEAFNRLNVEAYVFALPRNFKATHDIDIKTTLLYKIARWVMKPDFVLALQPVALPEAFPSVRHYSYLTSPGTFCEQYRYYDGGLCGYDPSALPSPDRWRTPTPLIIYGAYPSYFTTFFAPLRREKIILPGSTWDEQRSSERYKNFYRLLDDCHILDLYGPQDTWENYQGYKGLADNLDLINKIKDAGVGLCLHSLFHLSTATPSSRIFEFVAAGVVVICDKHPWVIRHFGDSVLYFNHTASSEEMAAQVQKHLEWIQKNPEKATEMARKAHEIFLKHFASEIALKELLRQHLAQYNKNTSQGA